MTAPHAPTPLSDDPATRPFLLAGSGTGVLLLHGFTSTPQSMRHVGHALHAASGATLLAPCLAGHGTTPEALAATGHLDWLASAEAALEELRARCDRVIVAGLSLGGTLALNLAARWPERVAGVVSINGSTGIYRPEVVLPLFDTTGPDYLPGIGSDLSDPEAREICYDRIARSTLRERFLLTHATGGLLSLIRQPCLVIQSREDGVISPANARRILREVASDEVRLCWLTRSRHVATLDYDKDHIVALIHDFLNQSGNA